MQSLRIALRTRRVRLHYTLTSTSADSRSHQAVAPVRGFSTSLLLRSNAPETVKVKASVSKVFPSAAEAVKDVKSDSIVLSGGKCQGRGWLVWSSEVRSTSTGAGAGGDVSKVSPRSASGSWDASARGLRRRMDPLWYFGRNRPRAGSAGDTGIAIACSTPHTELDDLRSGQITAPELAFRLVGVGRPSV